jgi:hypothetical protein
VFNTTDYSVDPQTTPGGASISLHTIRTIVITAGTIASGDVPDFTAWLDHGNAHKDAFENISAAVSYNAAVWNNGGGSLLKSIKRWESGLVTVNITLGHTAAVSAGASVLTGLPTSSDIFYSIVYGLDDLTTAVKFVYDGLNGTLTALDAIASTNKSTIISFTYNT